MTLVRFNQKPAVSRFDNLFDEFFNNWPASWNMNRALADEGLARVNIHETEDGYHVELNVPGRNKEDFNIAVDNGMLSISYEKKEEKESDSYKTIRREFSFGSFKRSFYLDDTIQSDNIQAKYENGVLKLFLPKRIPQKESVKQINIQ